MTDASSNDNETVEQRVDAVEARLPGLKEALCSHQVADLYRAAKVGICGSVTVDVGKRLRIATSLDGVEIRINVRPIP